MVANLPQLQRPTLTDGGLETDLIFNRGIELPSFSAVVLLQSPEGYQALQTYYRPYLELARQQGLAFILESPTWRASPDWAAPLGLSDQELDQLVASAVGLMADLKREYEDERFEVIVSGCIGPRGDGYDPGQVMTISEAHAYHRHQARVMADAGAEMIAAITMTNVNEAVGVARAAQDVGLPVAISFTVETDGRLPTGDTLAEAVQAVDQETGGYPAYFMINCAHPDHFASALDAPSDWVRRVRGVRANASRCSHDELNAMTELDAGDPTELGQLHHDLRQAQPQITVLGGCCGTDIRHVTAIAEACAGQR